MATTYQTRNDLLDRNKTSGQQKQYSPSPAFGGQPLDGMPGTGTSQPGGTFPTAQAPGPTRQTAATAVGTGPGGAGGWGPRPWGTDRAKAPAWQGQLPGAAAQQQGQAASQAAQLSPEGMALLKDAPELAAWMEQRSSAEALAKREGVLEQGMGMLAENEADVGLPASYWDNTAIRAQGAVNAQLLAAQQRLREQFHGRENSSVFRRRMAEIEDDYRNRAVEATTTVDQQRREMNEAAKLARANQYGTYAGLMPTEGTAWTQYGNYMSGGSPAEQQAAQQQGIQSALGGVRAIGGGGGSQQTRQMEDAVRQEELRQQMAGLKAPAPAWQAPAPAPAVNPKQNWAVGPGQY